MSSTTVMTRPEAPHRATDRYHPLRVKRVVAETSEAVSIVFDVPADLKERFIYRAGQYVTLRVMVDGAPQLRSYSMSSTPTVDEDLQVTVKRVPDGFVSKWLTQNVAEGDVIGVSAPTGRFVLTDSDAPVVAFAGGSGITPIFSLVKQVMHSTERRVRLLLANPSRDAAIFGAELDGLAERFPGRLLVEHHEDVTSGFVTAADVQAFVGSDPSADVYICGPGGFMDVVERTLIERGVASEQIHIERFTPVAPAEPAAPSAPARPAVDNATVTITVDGQTKTVDQRANLTILQSARFGGLPAPSSCEIGECATCMAKVLEGEVANGTNDILTPEEIEEGWVLTCQAVPVTPVVRVVYET